MEENEVGILKPNEHIRPEVSEETAVDLLRSLYGMQANGVDQLPSYDDRNFLFQTTDLAEDESSNYHLAKPLWPHGYILKIINVMDSSVPGLLESIVESLRHVHSYGTPSVPQPILNRDGHYITREAVDGQAKEKGKVNVIYLLTFCPGTTLYHVPYTADVLFGCGLLLARLTDALQTFRNEVLEKRKHHWSLYSVPRLRDFLFAVEDDGRRRLVTDVIDEFTNCVLPAVESFPLHFIHGDVNEHNLILRETDSDRWEPYAVIDFADSHRAPLIFEVSIFLVYAILECRTMDPLDAAAVALAGFLNHRRLESSEFKLLKPCIAARLTQSLVMGAYSHKLDPSNTYVLSTSKTGWAVLERLWTMPTVDLYRKWETVIGRQLAGKKALPVFL